MKTNLLWAAAGLCGLFACTPEKEVTTVHLKGQLVEMGSENVVMRYDGAASLLGGSKDVVLKTDAEGRFDTILHIAEPTYYTISRNTLYLTPGDDLTVKITTNNEEADFQGVGAEANNYMKYRLFPKGGSYLEAGKNLRGDFNQTKLLIDSLADVRRAELEALTKVSDEFKELEGARINADVANSYIMYANYAGVTQGAKDRDEARKLYEKFMVEIKPHVHPLLAALNKDSYLNVAVARDVLGYVMNEDPYGWAEEIAFSPMAKELYAAADMARVLRSKVTTQVVDSVKAFMSTVKNQDLVTELDGKLKKASRLLAGSPAIDILMQDVDGKEYRISDFKGKVLYIDLWATWCGPCNAEAPYFEELAKEYKGKDVVFIPISTDTNQKAWKEYLGEHKKELVQYHSVDMSLKEGWEIFYIPRFLVIDKQFNIADAYAPRPSDKEAIKAVLDRELAR